MNDLTRPILIRPRRFEFGAGTARSGRPLGRRRRASAASSWSPTPSTPTASTGWGCAGSVTVFGEVKPEPDTLNLEGLLARAAVAEPDLIVGFGGGSAMDLAKLVTVLRDGTAARRGDRPEPGAPAAGRARPGADHRRHRQRGRHPRADHRHRHPRQARGREPASARRHGRPRPRAHHLAAARSPPPPASTRSPIASRPSPAARRTP